MKIELSSGKELDTEKLNDVEAEVMEKFNEIYKLSDAYHIPMMCVAFVGAKPMSVHNFQNGNSLIDLCQYIAWLFKQATNGAVKFFVSVENSEE